MANYSGSPSQHKTLTANTVDKVTLDQDYNEVEVVHRGTTGELYFSTDRQVDDSGNAVTATDPTVGGAGTDVVLPGSALKVSVPGSAGNTVVRLISTAAAPYSVKGVK